MADSGETIVAIASPAGAGRRGVLRLSGPAALELTRQVTQVGSALDGRPRRGVYRGRFDDGGGSQPLLLLWMNGPHSFTREDVAEFHLCGSPPLLERALRRLLELGARPALRGEFTRRAFESGRIDLTRAEGVLALIGAQNEAERRSAAALLFGGLEERVLALRAGFMELRSLCEASLDFDEYDTAHVSLTELEQRARGLVRACLEARGWEERRSAALAELRVVLVGAPNSGKSSLFNALVEEGSAIVSGSAGTTRDVLEGRWLLAGTGVLLCDTAGLAEGGCDTVAAAAQLQAAGFRAGADLCLEVLDRSAPEASLSHLDLAAPTILVWNKCDLAAAQASAPQDGGGCLAQVSLSARSGAGLLELAEIVAAALGLAPREGTCEGASASAGRLERELSARHRAALQATSEALEEGLRGAREGSTLDLFAEHLRRATDALDSISGHSTPEDLLDRVFGAFCIGK